MHWKHYKALPLAEKLDESYYIIGLDIGNDSTGISYYNLYENKPEAIDPSGGYGRPSIPTVAQYIPETKEWVFGEYALLNQSGGTEVNIKALIQRLGQFDYLEIDGKDVSVANILGLFIKDLLASVRSINPRAEIAGIVAAIPAYMSQPAQDELTRAFKLAGYEKELISLVPDRECILAHHFQNAPNPDSQDEKVLLLDYGSREVRGGVYSIGADSKAKSLSSIFDASIGTSQIDDDVYALFESYYLASGGAETAQDIAQLTAFFYQHKDILFQKNIRSKPAKLYFNFVYPPFQQTVTNIEVDQLIGPYERLFNRFIVNTLEKTLPAEPKAASHTPKLPRPLAPNDITTVICTGGGFEMLWAREAVAELFAPSQINIYKNAKLVTTEGAAIVAAQILGVTIARDISIEDNHQLLEDIGLKTDEDFLPLVELGAFWWQKHQPTLVLVNSPVGGRLQLSVAKRTAMGEARQLATWDLSGLPIRPKGTTRLKFDVNFNSDTDMILSVEDLGFGELFPKTSYTKEFALRLA